MKTFKTILMLCVLCFAGSAWGAELLIKMQDSGGYNKKGHVSAVQIDDFKWGIKECSPRFLVVKVPGLSVEEAKKYVLESVNTEKEYVEDFPITKPKYIFKDTVFKGDISTPKTIALKDLQTFIAVETDAVTVEEI